MKGFLKILAAVAVVSLLASLVYAGGMRDFYKIRTDMNEAEVEEAMGGSPDKVIDLGTTVDKDYGRYVRKDKYLWIYYRSEGGSKKRIEIEFVNGIVKDKTWHFAR